MIRTRADLLAKGWTALELGMALLLVWAGGAIGGLLPGEPLLARVVGIVVGFALGVLLPSLLVGLPKFELRWSVDGRTITGSTVVDLRGKAVPAIDFSIELHGGYQSLLGRFLLHRAKTQSMHVWVQFRPVGAVRVLLQQPNPGSSLEDANSAPTIRLDVIDDDQDSAQTLFVGSMLPGTTAGVGDNVTVRAELRRNDGVTRPWWAPVASGLQSITVRK